MRSPTIFVVIASSLSLAGGHIPAPALVANASCTGAEAGAAVAVAVTTDANTGANATKAAGRAQQTASAVQQAVDDACPLIVSGVSAVNAAAGGAGK